MTGDTILYGAIELGGTKILCAVGTAARIESQIQFATTGPVAAVSAIGAFFDAATLKSGPVAAAGVASFGPLDLDPRSRNFGALTTTPKSGWGGFALRAALAARLGVPVAIDTDVNLAALAEARCAAADETVAYITIGTGIGVGFANRRGVVRGSRHAEAGHVRPRRHGEHGEFAGICPYHGDCMEGLASGPAIIAAWGGSLAMLSPTHPAWAVEADYLGQLCSAITLMSAPDRIVIGGGVMAQSALLPAIRARTRFWLGGYIADLDCDVALETFIQSPASGSAPGLIGALNLAGSENLSTGLDLATMACLAPKALNPTG